MKQNPVLITPSNYFWYAYNLSKHLPVEFATFCDENVFWQIENAGNARKKPLKTTFLLQKTHKNAPK